MKKKLVLLLLLTCMTFQGCAGSGVGINGPNASDSIKHEEYEYDVDLNTPAISPSWYRKVAREEAEDGWVFTFVKNGMKDPEEDQTVDDIIRYQFFGINIRYQTMDGYENDDGGILIWGDANEAQERDFGIIHEILDNSRTTEELLALNPEDYTFEELDGELFFRLMREALTSDWQEEGKLQAYWDKPTYAMLEEPDFTDGYKFQVAFLQETGGIDELFIDVLYIDDTTADAGYVQLSDLVEQNRGNEEQIKLWEEICAIVEAAKEEQLFITGSEDYQNEVISEVDLCRLYVMMKDIHENRYWY